MNDFTCVHKSMEAPTGLQDKSLNLQWKLREGLQTLVLSFWMEYALPFS